jgi:cytochrome c biogenesis protein CcdA
MLRLLGLALTVGLADSLNPSTIGPALYLATGRHGRRQVVHFTVGVFVVYFVGGALIALGPGQLLLSILPHPHRRTRWIIEIAVGASLLAAAAFLWHNRQRLAERDVPSMPTHGKSSALLGASIIAVELPTAFPYFAVIAALVGSDIDVFRQIVLLAVFNLCFVLPMIGIIATLSFAGERSNRLLRTWRDYLNRYWPQLLTGLLALAGLIVLGLGLTGLTEHAHGPIGSFARHVRHLLKP